MLVGGQPEPQAELGVVLEQRVGPGRPAPLRVGRPRGRGEVAAVDGGTAGRVGDHRAVAEQLGEELEVGGLAAARARARELEEWLEELGAADGAEVHAGAVGHGQGLEERHVPPRRVGPGLAGDQVDGLAGRVARGERRARLHAQPAPGAVLGVHLQRVPRTGQPDGPQRGGVEVLRSAVERRAVVEARADHAVRAHERAVAALDARVRVPLRDRLRDGALLEGGRTDGVGAVHGQRAHGQGVPTPGHHLGGHGADELRRVGRHHGGRLADAGDLARDRDGVQARQRAVDRRVLPLHQVAAPVAVGLLHRLLDQRYRPVARQDPDHREVAGLHHHVDAPRQPGLAGDAVGVHHVHLDPLVHDLPLHPGRQRVPHPLRPQRAVEEQRRAVRRAVEHVDGLEEPGLVHAHHLRARDQVRRADLVRSEAQVGDGLGAGLLGVVDEVALDVQRRVRAEDLDGVLGGADRAVGAEPVEDRAHRPVGVEVEVGVDGQARAGHVVEDPHREARPRPSVAVGVDDELREHRGGHRRGELLGREPVATADHPGHPLAAAVTAGLGERRDHVEVQRLAVGAGLLGAVEHGHRPHCRGQRVEQRPGGERPVQAHLQHADPLPAGVEGLGCGGGGLGTRPHDHHHALGVRGAGVLDDPQRPAGALGEGVHEVRHRLRHAGVERVDGLAGLEVGVRVLGGAADHRPLRGERA